MRPLFNNVLIKRTISNKTKGGIYVPDKTAERWAAAAGEVVRIGETADVSVRGGEHNGKKYESCLGKRVMFGEYAGAWVNLENCPFELTDDERLYLIKDEDIMGVLDD